VTLDHVDEGAGLVVVARPALEPEGLVVDDVDAGDVLRGEQRLDDAVGEAQAEQVEHGRPAEEVVDAVDARLWEERVQQVVEVLGALGVGAEGLLERETGPRGQVEVLEDRAALLGDGGRQGEVHGRVVPAVGEQRPEVVGTRHVRLPVARRVDHGLQPLGQTSAAGRALVLLVLRRLRVREGVVHELLPVAVRQVFHAGTDELDVPVGLHLEQGREARQEQPLGQVATGAEDEE
jgi:hypothetical protein